MKNDAKKGGDRFDKFFEVKKYFDSYYPDKLYLVTLSYLESLFNLIKFYERVSSNRVHADFYSDFLIKWICNCW